MIIFIGFWPLLVLAIVITVIISAGITPGDILALAAIAGGVVIATVAIIAAMAYFNRIKRHSWPRDTRPALRAEVISPVNREVGSQAQAIESPREVHYHFHNQLTEAHLREIGARGPERRIDD